MGGEVRGPHEQRRRRFLFCPDLELQINIDGQPRPCPQNGDQLQAARVKIGIDGERVTTASQDPCIR